MNMYQKLLALITLRETSHKRFASRGKQAAIRLAYRHLKKALTEDGLYDVMARLVILEGAAGVREFTWAQNPMRGLKKAQAHLAEYVPDMDPDWFLPNSTGMVRMLTRQLDGWLSRSGVPDMTGEDVVQDGVAGLGADVDEEGEVVRRKIKNKFWEAGKFLSAGILDGTESPGKVAAGALGKSLKKAALNVINKLRRHQRIQGITLDTGPHGQTEEGGHGGVADPSQVSRDVFDMVFFSNDPLGKAVRQAIKKIIDTKIPTAAIPTMQAWWEALNRGEFISGKELAEAAGYIVPGMDSKGEAAAKVKVKKHWMAAMPVIFQAMEGNQSLQRAVRNRLDTLGVETQDISWSDIMEDESTFGRFRKYGFQMEAILRQDVCKLASGHPELRQHLVPLLRG